MDRLHDLMNRGFLAHCGNTERKNETEIPSYGTRCCATSALLSLNERLD
jgi:hypothetical protein